MNATPPGYDLDVKVLSGLRVLDLTRVLAGPYCTQLLANLGAEVLKIEPPDGDETREWGPPFEDGVSAYFLSVNRGKETRRIDFKSSAEEVRELASKVDVLVENYRVGDLARYGLDYVTLAALNPNLVYCSITGFGQSGPRAQEPGYDAVIQGYCGIMSVTGDAEGPPTKVGVAWVDVLTGTHAAVAILAALRAGKGCHIDMSLFDVGLAAMTNLAQTALMTGEAPTRRGNMHAQIVPYGTFPAADGWLVIACGNDGQFAKLCGALGVDWVDDPRFVTNPKRVRNRMDLEAMIGEITQKRSRSEWLERFKRAGVPCGPVNDLQEALRDPQTAARNMVLNGRVGCPIRFS